MSQSDHACSGKLTRRRLVQAGAALTPIILTLRARPALGQEGDGSRNVSGIPHYGKPGKWKLGHDGDWHWEGFIDPNTGDWNGRGESPDHKPPRPEGPHGHAPETPPGHSPD